MDKFLNESNVKNMVKMRKILCCEQYSLLLDTNGGVYECKKMQQNNEEEKIDINNKMVSRIDEKWFRNEKIMNIECGWIHNIALSEARNVYVWGSNLYHCCLHTEAAFVEYPRLISHFVSPMISVKMIDCGLWHCCVLTEIGDVYVWGLNKFGQLGAGKDVSHAKDPLLVAFGNEEVECVTMSSGASHICVIDSNAWLWGWGYNKFNQIAQNDEECIWKPMQIETKKKMKNVKCGHWLTSYSL